MLDRYFSKHPYLHPSSLTVMSFKTWVILHPFFLTNDISSSSGNFTSKNILNTSISIFIINKPISQSDFSSKWRKMVILNSPPIPYFTIVQTTSRMIFKKITKLGLTHYSDSILNIVQISVSLCCHLYPKFYWSIPAHIVSLLKILEMLNSQNNICLQFSLEILNPQKDFFTSNCFLARFSYK